MKYFIYIAICITSFNVFAQVGFPLEHSFNYQGELMDNGIPANGIYDIKITPTQHQLPNLPTYGKVSEHLGVTVTNGLFTIPNVDLVDPLATNLFPYDGIELWLQIEVRQQGALNYVMLSPKQPINSVPYATTLIDKGATDGQVLTFSDIFGWQPLDPVFNSVTTTDIVDGTIQAIDIDNSQIQQRVTTVCSGGRVIKSVGASGIASCVFPTPNDNSVNSAKIIDGSIVSVDVDTTQIQKRIIGSCNLPEYLTGVTQTGNVICSRLPIGASNNLDSPITAVSSSNTNIVIGSNGLPIINYRGTPPNAIKTINCSNQSCSTFNSPQTLSNIGFYNSMVLGSDNNPIISYYYSDVLKELMVIKCNNQDCSQFNLPITLDSTGNVGLNTSIAIGTDGLPIISYSTNDISDEVRVIKCNDLSCTGFNPPITLATTTNTLIGTSIAIGTDTFPIISFTDLNTLKTIKCNSIDCSSTLPPVTIDSGSFFRDDSMVIGSDGMPIISYTDLNNLKMVKCTNFSCTGFVITILDTIGKGRGNSIAIGFDGNPIISYLDFSNFNLKVVKCNDKSCSLFNTPLTLDSIGDVGFSTSIAIGTDGNPMISYLDSTNQSLKVYSCGDPECRK